MYVKSVLFMWFFRWYHSKSVSGRTLIKQILGSTGLFLVPGSKKRGHSVGATTEERSSLVLRDL